jgi:signal transduction histidine kinase
MGNRWPGVQGPKAWSFGPLASDCLLAAALLAVFEASAFRGFYAPLPVLTRSHVLWAMTGGVLTLPVAVRRRYPFGVWLASTASAGLLLAIIGHSDPFVGVPGLLPGILGSPAVVLPAPLVALYTIARSRPRGWLALAGSLVTLAPTTLWSLAELSEPRHPVHSLERCAVPPCLAPPVLGSRTAYMVTLVMAGALVTAWALGETVRARRESSDVRRAAAEAEEAEHDRAVAAQERARIARELHDITAHHISVVTLQAGAARLLAESGGCPVPSCCAGSSRRGGRRCSRSARRWE